MITRDDLLALMLKLDACAESVEWVEAAPHKSAKALIRACHRGDWLLWLANRLRIEMNFPCENDNSDGPVAGECDCSAQYVRDNVPWPLWRAALQRDVRRVLKR